MRDKMFEKDNLPVTFWSQNDLTYIIFNQNFSDYGLEQQEIICIINQWEFTIINFVPPNQIFISLNVSYSIGTTDYDYVLYGSGKIDLQGNFNIVATGVLPNNYSGLLTNDVKQAKIDGTLFLNCNNIKINVEETTISFNSETSLLLSPPLTSTLTTSFCAKKYD